MKTITRTVWILSLVSLFTDMASEMLYPIMPIYLESIGFSILLIGVLEGLVEAVAGLSKGYFGQLSDSKAKRAPFVQLGYSFSALSKPMMAFFIYPLWIFFVRTVDRLGKGIRTGARDAMLSAETTKANKGKVFGFHRSMDTLGAVLGPALALLYLYFNPKDYINLFYIAFIPGVLAVVASFLLKDKKVETASKNVINKQPKKKIGFFSFIKYWKQSSSEYRKVVIGLLFFALFNSSDVFLLLKAKDAGLDDTWVIGIYIFYNLIFALTAYPLGSFADKIGLKKMFVFGLIIFSIVYFGMGLTTNLYAIIALFFGYGIFGAATEGISKAWITNLAKDENTATAIGTFTAFQSIVAMIASVVAGLLWFYFGASVTFFVTAIATVFVIIYFLGNASLNKIITQSQKTTK
ncbi:sugar phosphate permease [Aequorivita sublithincola DSM 14238]|uniref:Sugar phosphate permease n=1 Tax=Aequorivita sublithincola (strain DSM 14238 / LMG 21431 / ACAM 643 / 9-3) TaxID=746697 RepID=I3YY70_AEQSU|nr:MFS transporter [Aequorivita sublithincola]AFL81938.1 sugar phosphate permease [Aequorivita sublithincola DSM 14238]